MSRGAPHWVYKRDQALRDSAHMDYERKLQDRIRELEKENAARARIRKRGAAYKPFTSQARETTSLWS